MNHLFPQLIHVLLLVPLLFNQTMKANPDSEQMLFDFSSPTNAAWQIVNDDVMGGVSTSSFSVTNCMAVFRGDVSLENNGGFASVRSLPVRHAWGKADCFVIRVRGDGRRYKFTARTNRSFDGINYQYTFKTRNGEWQEQCLPLKDFVPSFRGRLLQAEPPLSSHDITSIGFLISERQEGRFKLEIAWIKLRRPAG